jgi:hypothetical protein
VCNGRFFFVVAVYRRSNYRSFSECESGNRDDSSFTVTVAGRSFEPFKLVGPSLKLLNVSRRQNFSDVDQRVDKLYTFSPIPFGLGEQSNTGRSFGRRRGCRGHAGSDCTKVNHLAHISSTFFISSFRSIIVLKHGYVLGTLFTGLAR